MTKTQDTNRAQLNKVNLKILHWVKFFTKALGKDDQKERPLKSVKNIESKIEDKNNEQLESIKNQPNTVDEKPKGQIRLHT